MRLLRTNSSKTTFEESLVKFKQHLRIRGYPKTVIQRSFQLDHQLSHKRRMRGFAFCNYVPPRSEQPEKDTEVTMESNAKSAFAENFIMRGDRQNHTRSPWRPSLTLSL